MHYLRIGTITRSGRFFLAAIVDESGRPATVGELQRVVGCFRRTKRRQATEVFLPEGSDTIYLAAAAFATKQAAREAVEDVLYQEGFGLGQLIEVDFSRRAG